MTSERGSHEHIIYSHGRPRRTSLRNALVARPPFSMVCASPFDDYDLQILGWAGELDCRAPLDTSASPK